MAGQRYIVSMFGTMSDWVHNLEAVHGDAVISHGGSLRVRLVPVRPQERAPILREYVRVASSGRKHFRLRVEAPLADFAAIAAQYPVYRIEVSLPDRGAYDAAYDLNQRVFRLQRDLSREGRECVGLDHRHGEPRTCSRMTHELCRSGSAGQADTGRTARKIPQGVGCYPAGRDQFAAPTSRIQLPLRRSASASFLPLWMKSRARSACRVARAFRHLGCSRLPLTERSSATAWPSS